MAGKSPHLDICLLKFQKFKKEKKEKGKKKELSFFLV
jgi:hypothetical protein